MNASNDSDTEDQRPARYNIGEAANASGVSARMIRHYEATGLIRPPDRSLANYRVYSEDDVHRLRFIRRARDLGFAMEQIGRLLALWDDPCRSSADVKQLALDHAASLGRKLDELRAMQQTLLTLASHCHGDDRPRCPILADLSGESETKP
ncbi:MAG: Cu(I)-responsive transcriptional regulator [Xanthomonadales bacterium]|nr:Cu(I)-responsive transcriptional regulator [Xanthomonadales bacterium]MCB1627094.1 Cu(I)-responsive transcriptional regulator [Xanthomonadales bacterium]MCB1642462.1 Cu(I)-responsive transcriptional regulator [Xanthomonadales bacterium]